jgi:hypothetical protein
MDRKEMGLLKKKKEIALFHAKRKRMPFGDKGQFQKLFVGILKRLGPEMDWNLVDIHREILGQIRIVADFRIFQKEEFLYIL